jgi:hypothetical protein
VLSQSIHGALGKFNFAVAAGIKVSLAGAGAGSPVEEGVIGRRSPLHY